MPRLPQETECTLIGCPDCSGVLSRVQDDDSAHVQYICHVGHVYSIFSLLEAKEVQLEHALWSVVSLLQHVEMIDESLLAHIDENGMPISKEGLLVRREQVRAQLALVRNIIEETRPPTLESDIDASDTESA